MTVIKSMSIIGFGHYVEKQEYAHLFDKVTAASIIIIYAIAMMLYLIHRRARFFFCLLPMAVTVLFIIR